MYSQSNISIHDFQHLKQFSFRQAVYKLQKHTNRYSGDMDAIHPCLNGFPDGVLLVDIGVSVCYDKHIVGHIFSITIGRCKHNVPHQPDGWGSVSASGTELDIFYGLQNNKQKNKYLFCFTYILSIDGSALISSHIVK